jgi:hypothetical protein
VVGDARPIPAGPVRAGFDPAGDAAAVVVDLPAHEVGGQDVARGRPPGLVGAEHAHVAGAEGDVQLGEERRGGAVGVDRPDDAVLAAPPPVAQQRTERVASFDDQVGDVEGLHLEPLAVRGEPRGQLAVADAIAVDEGLVEPVRGGMHERGGDRTVDRELARQVVGRAVGVGRVGWFGGLDP